MQNFVFDVHKNIDIVLVIAFEHMRVLPVNRLEHFKCSEVKGHAYIFVTIRKKIKVGV